MPCAPTGSLARPPYDFLRTDRHGHPLRCATCGEPLQRKMIGTNDSLLTTLDGRAFDDFGEPPADPVLGFPHPLMPWNRSRMHVLAPCPDPEAPVIEGADVPPPECCGLPMQLRDDGWRCRERGTLVAFDPVSDGAA